MVGSVVTAGVAAAGAREAVLHGAVKDVVRLADAAVVVVAGHEYAVWRSKLTVADAWTSKETSRRTLMSTTKTTGSKTTIFGE